MVVAVVGGVAAKAHALRFVPFAGIQTGAGLSGRLACREDPVVLLRSRLQILKCVTSLEILSPHGLNRRTDKSTSI